MSTMKTNIAKREKSLMAAKAIGSLMAIAVLAIVIFSTNVVTQADEMGADGTAVLATSSDAVARTASDEVQSGVIQDEDGYFRYYVNGEVQKNAGWIDAEDGTRYLIDENGVAAMKFTRTGDTIRIYRFSTDSKDWLACSNEWIVVDDVLYYLDRSGSCIKEYNKNNKKARVLSGGKLVPAKNQMIDLDDGKTYYFNSNAERVVKGGWYQINNDNMMYVTGGGSHNVIVRIYKTSGTLKMYTFNDSKKEWSINKNQWKNTGNKVFYFDGSGNCTVIYDQKSRILYKYSSGDRTYKRVSNVIDKLNGSKYCFYDKNGVRITSEGWKKVDSNTAYYVVKGGYVTSLYIDKKGTKKIYDFDYSNNKWVLKKNQWRNVYSSKYYFGAKGVATISYNNNTQKAYKFTGRKWKPAKKTIIKIGSANYYFNSAAKRVTKAGKYKTSNGYIAYVNRRGVVYKREYDLSVKRYYTIDLGKGRKTRVYGYYDIGAANRLSKMVNQHRAENGLSSLKVSTSLTETATTRAKEISNKYSHYRPNGTLCLNSMYELYGENLACGFSGGDLVFRAWSKSTAHDSNMLNTTYKTMGVAVFVALKNDKQGYKRYYVLTFGK